MQRLIILRLAAGLIALFIGMALLFGWAAAPPSGMAEGVVRQDGDRGAMLFQQRCGRCHTHEEVLEWLRLSTEIDPGGALLAFLEEHGEASRPENRAIVVHLESPATAP